MIPNCIASSHIIAVFSKNVTASQAETILTMLTHNATSGRIGNNVTISSSSLHLLHLPNDILSAIPTSVMNSGMGEGPDYYSLGSVIGDIAGMVFDFLVWVASGGVLLLLAHLVKEGLKAIANLVSTAITAVEAAVDRIVDAFCAMVDWAVSFITNLIHSVIDPVTNAMYDLWSNYKASVNSALLLAQADYSSTGEVSDNALRTLRCALDGELYYVILGVTLSISIILFAITCVTNVLSFLLITAMSILAYIIIENSFAANDAQEVDINPREFVGNGNISNLTNEIFIIYGSSYGVQIDAEEHNVLDAVLAMVFGEFGAKIGLCAAYWNVLSPSRMSVLSVIAGLLAASLSIPGEFDDSKILSYVSIALGGISLGAGFESLFGATPAIKGLGVFSMVLGGISLWYSFKPFIN